MTSKHPQRCETCKHRDADRSQYPPAEYSCYCNLKRMWVHMYCNNWIGYVGCASHSSASEPVSEPNPCEENGCADIENCDEICEHMRIYSPAYVRESRQKARADVLDDVIKFCETEHSAPPHEETAFRVSRYAKSLRQQEGMR